MGVALASAAGLVAVDTSTGAVVSDFAPSLSICGKSTGILTGVSGGISGGRSSSTTTTAAVAFGKVALTSADLGRQEAKVSGNGADTAGLEDTGVFTGTHVASSTVCLVLVSTVFSFAAVTLLSMGAGAGTNASPFLVFPCFPALTTFGITRLAGLAEELSGVEARGDGMGDRGAEVVDFGEVGEEEQADIEERFRLPGTALGAEEPRKLLASLLLGFTEPEAA